VKEITQIGKYNVEIWRRPYQRSMNLRVRRDGIVRVTCGRGVSKTEVKRFVAESEKFIDLRLGEIQSMRQRFPEKQFLTGEELLLLGAKHQLTLVWTWASKIKIKSIGSQIEMMAPLQTTRAERQKAFNFYCRKQARKFLQERVLILSQAMQLFPKTLTIRGQKTRWGSCSSEGTLSLNWKLIAAPPDVIDYVVVHELAHIRHLNHSADFWHLVARHHREWKLARHWLKENEYKIATQFQTPVLAPRSTNLEASGPVAVSM
jgi:predicted metal-dependent hydrolase